MYQVLARKWRPQNFGELVGQTQVARSLSNAIDSRRLAHAYIFAGLRGTGKTTVARILAKCLNCEKGPATEPCDACDACREIAESRAMDVLEIDAASRTKVEQTRELLEMVSYAPVRDRYKILIIDEAHMLSKASFNALLKTLEEPPPNVVFVLATTEMQKVLPTILSRCQVFEFRRVAARELAKYLRKVCEAEEIRISDAALERLARAGEGSVRDSLSALERVLAFCGQDVDDAEVLRMLGAVRAEVLTEMVSALARRDAAGMLTVLDGLVDEGHDLVHLWNELIAAFRDLLLLEALPDRQELLARSPDEAEALRQSASGLSGEDLTRAFQILADLEPALKSSSQPQFLFEVTMLRLASLAAVRPIEELLQSIGGETARTVTRTASPPAPPRKQKKKLDETGGNAPADADSAGLMTAIRDARPMLGAILAQASGVSLAGGSLRIGFPDGMSALKRQLERPDSLATLREQAERLAGRSVDIRIEVGSPGHTAPAAQEPSPATKIAKSPPRKQKSRREDRPTPADPPKGGDLLDAARQEPGIEKLLDAFGAHVVDIRPMGISRETERDPEPMEDP